MDTVIQSQRKSRRFKDHGDYHFHCSSVYCLMGFLIRFQSRWVEIHPRPFEPERMTTDIAWLQIKEGISVEEAYRKWFETQRKLSRLLQQ